MNISDSLHYIQLEQIFRQCGYPTAAESGPNGPFLFWTLVQHQDAHPAFQDSVLTAMKPLVDSGEVSGILYAYLLDRVRRNTGRLQVYGTQLQLNADSTSYEMQPCEDPANVNTRRKSIGLGTIEEYIAANNKRLKQ
jgi:hypothetical protein